MQGLMTWGLGVLGLAVVIAPAALGQEGWGDATWWHQATPAAVQARLDRGAVIGAQDPNGWTPLHYAARNNAAPAVVALVLDRGAVIDAQDQVGATPLHYAARDNAAPAVVALLLDRGAAIDAQNRFSVTPLDYAAWGTAAPAVAALLLDRGGTAQETWRCFARFDFAKETVLFTLYRLEGDASGLVSLPGLSPHPASFRVAGLNRRWDWGDSVYAFIIKPDGTGLYYDFSMSEDGTAKPSGFYECLSF